MGEEGIRVYLDSTARSVILSQSKYRIIKEIVEAYTKTPEYTKMVNSIDISKDELKQAVMDKMAEKIIQKWVDD